MKIPPEFQQNFTDVQDLELNTPPFHALTLEQRGSMALQEVEAAERRWIKAMEVFLGFVQEERDRIEDMRTMAAMAQHLSVDEDRGGKFSVPTMTATATASSRAAATAGSKAAASSKATASSTATASSAAGSESDGEVNPSVTEKWRRTQVMEKFVHAAVEKMTEKYGPDSRWEGSKAEHLAEVEAMAMWPAEATAVVATAVGDWPSEATAQKLMRLGIPVACDSRVYDGEAQFGLYYDGLPQDDPAPRPARVAVLDGRKNGKPWS